MFYPIPSLKYIYCKEYFVLVEPTGTTGQLKVNKQIIWVQKEIFDEQLATCA